MDELKLQKDLQKIKDLEEQIERQEKEIQEQRKQIKKNEKVVKYLDYKMPFICTENKQILFIGKPLKAYKFYIYCKFLQFISKSDPELLHDKILIIKGLKKTAQFLDMDEMEIINKYNEHRQKG